MFPLMTSHFRRTLAWFIARQPGGTIAGALQYRHHGIQVFEGYAGTSDSGFRAEVESEQALARGEHYLAMVDAHEHTELTGPTAAEAARRLEDFGHRARIQGTVVTDERRLNRIMKREDPARSTPAPTSPASTITARRSASVPAKAASKGYPTTANASPSPAGTWP
jgi:hypothetical protein